MDFSSIPGQIYLDNKFVKSKNAVIHVLTHSLHFAGSVFEGIGVYNRKPLLMREHYLRLLLSAKLIGIKPNKTLQQLEKISFQLIKKNKIFNGYIRPIFFRSAHSMSPDTKNCKTRLAIAAWNWSKLYGDEGVKLNYSKWPKLNEKIFPISAKSSASYQTSVIEKINSDKRGFHDAVTLDLNDGVAETTACNIFWIKKNVIFTPQTHSILNGITRRVVIKLAKKLKFKIKIGNFKRKDLLNAENVFVTATQTENKPVKKIEKKNFKTTSNILSILKFEYEKIKKKGPNLISRI